MQRVGRGQSGQFVQKEPVGFVFAETGVESWGVRVGTRVGRMMGFALFIVSIVACVDVLLLVRSCHRKEPRTGDQID